MKDTAPETEALYRSLLMRRSGEERLLMAGRMFDSARTMVRASLAAQGIAGDAAATRAAIFLRFYGSDFDPETRDHIAERIRSQLSGSVD